MTSSQPLTLEDVQGRADTRGIALQKVGVSHVEMPIRILQKSGAFQTVSADVTMGVDLPATEKGTHLSRFIIKLAEASTQNQAFGLDLKEFLTDLQSRLQASAAYLSMGFKYYVDKAAPVSKLSAPVGYACRFEADLIDTTYRFRLGLVLPIATLCPCSKAISNYGAHNQRAEIRILLDIDTQDSFEMLWIEDMVALLDETSSCPVYPVLKREDEKYVTERAYDNPRFVEDVIRESIALLRVVPGLKGFSVEVEAFESIHGHNAWAKQEEGSFQARF